jgi:Domain of unknown function (DUF4034)
MNFLATLTFTGLLASGGALAAETGVPNNVDAANLFNIAPNAGSVSADRMIADEDQSNPLVEAHGVEQIRYAALYFSHYHGAGGPIDASTARDLPHPRDPQGHPLWSDKGNSDALLQTLVASLLDSEHFEDLDRVFEDWNDPSERMADGRWKLVNFQAGIKAFFGRQNIWDARYPIFEHWRQKNPQSRAAALAEAIYWFDYGWNARGGGVAGSVAPEGWKLFAERLKKAETVLVQSKPYASGSPLWWSLAIEVGNGLSWQKSRIMDLFAESAKTGKCFYSTYLSTIQSLTPLWGGDWKLVDRFVQDSVKNTEDVEGHSLYARLYWAADCDCEDFSLFRDSLASWPEMKRGFEDIIQRYPHSAFDLNKFAVYACIAGDKETFQSLRFRIGKLLTPQAWPSNYSIDLCEHKFALPPL